MEIGLVHYLLIAAFLFVVGSILVLTRRNGVMVLIGFELMINAAIINFVSFSRFDILRAGEVAALFILVLAVCASVVGLIILWKVFQQFQTINIDEIREIKE
jgi:NADH-quinone oxidoreductase subunit K